jgi:hypothetical protein
MAADDDLDALEAQLEGYDNDDDDDDIPPLKRVWKKFKVFIVVGAAFLVFIPVILLSMDGSDNDEPRLMIVPELAPEPGKQVKMSPDQPGGTQVGDQDKGVFNMVTEGENAGKIAITAPPEDPKTPPEGAEKTPEDSKNAEGSIMPPPLAPEKVGDAALPILPEPGAPAPDGGKTAESILPVPPAEGKAPDAKQPEVPAAVAMPPEQPAPPVTPPKAPANNNQIAVVIPKATTATVPVTPPPSPPPGNANVTPMRTMSGVYRIQVASARSETGAKTLWDKQVNKHPDVLGKLPLTVQTAVIQDRGTFYRVQGGAFGDREAADSVCRKLKSRGQDCIVVRP